MKTGANLSTLLAGLASVFLVGACGSGTGTGSAPLLGTWTYSGSVPAFVNVTLTFKSDNSFTFVEDVAPFSRPAGVDPNTCVTTDIYDGTHRETTSGGAGALTLNFAGGTANQVSGCSDSSWNSAGTPMTPDAIASYRAQGLIPPETVNYATTSTTLLLITPNDGSGGIGRGAGTTFVKSP
jgi:hypothetical protein